MAVVYRDGRWRDATTKRFVGGYPRLLRVGDPIDVAARLFEVVDSGDVLADGSEYAVLVYLIDADPEEDGQEQIGWRTASTSADLPSALHQGGTWLLTGIALEISFYGHYPIVDDLRVLPLLDRDDAFARRQESKRERKRKLQRARRAKAKVMKRAAPKKRAKKAPKKAPSKKRRKTRKRGG